MAEERVQRRLAAILAADVVGYSHLMELDEAGTLALLKSHREKFINPAIAYHHGRVVKLMGDGALVEFLSAVDAVQCVIAIQRGIEQSNETLSHAKRISYRIGINAGDVIIDGEDIYGDGVNVAVRLQELAESNGVCVSRTVFEQVNGKVNIVFNDMGERKVKNITRSVHAYGWTNTKDDSVSAATWKGCPPPLPDKPSIAVLPFANMSADSEQEHFSDGITEDIITALSKISDLFVIARHSTFAYKGKFLDVKQVSRELGVRHVLEGSVRRSGDTVRVSAQLIDATTGHHLWAERYDRHLKDIFAVQDAITRQVVIALDVRLRAGEQARFWSSGTENLEAWENIRLGMDLLNGGSLEGLRECQRLCDRALELDPNYAIAWVMRGWTHHHEVDVGIGRAIAADRQTELGLAIDCANKALKIDPLCVDAYSLLSFCHLSRGEHDRAIEMSDKALALAPNHSDVLAMSAVVHNKSGRPQRSLKLIGKAMRLCPIYPGTFLWILGTTYRLTGQMEAAVGTFQEAIKRSADFLAVHVALASTLGEMGMKERAETYASEILRLDPNFSIRRYMEGLSYKDAAEATRFAKGLHEAGLPA